MYITVKLSNYMLPLFAGFRQRASLLCRHRPKPWKLKQKLKKISTNTVIIYQWTQNNNIMIKIIIITYDTIGTNGRSIMRDDNN